MPRRLSLYSVLARSTPDLCTHVRYLKRNRLQGSRRRILRGDISAATPEVSSCRNPGQRIRYRTPHKKSDHRTQHRNKKNRPSPWILRHSAFLCLTIISTHSYPFLSGLLARRITHPSKRGMISPFRLLHCQTRRRSNTESGN